jgi:addiction module RelE/StbE family toxin
MKVRFHDSFIKQFKKLSPAQKQLVSDTIELFSENPTHMSLRNHALRDTWANYRSITADGDLRLHYRVLDKATALFVAVGRHDELYK